jgi:hypothetical protein
MTQQNVGFPKLVNDLFGVVPFLRHGSDLLRWLFTTFDLDQLFQARSNASGPSPTSITPISIPRLGFLSVGCTLGVLATVVEVQS